MPCLRTDASTEALADYHDPHLHYQSSGNMLARLEALRTYASGLEETRSENSAISKWGDEFDLPISLLDRLLASRIVSLEAKISSIESWQRELEESHSCNPRTVELKRRLALARETLSKQPSDSPRWLLQRLSKRVRWLCKRASRELQRPSSAGAVGTLRTRAAKRPVGLEAALERWEAQDVGSMR